MPSYSPLQGIQAPKARNHTYVQSVIWPSSCGEKMNQNKVRKYNPTSMDNDLLKNLLESFLCQLGIKFISLRSVIN